MVHYALRREPLSRSHQTQSGRNHRSWPIVLLLVHHADVDARKLGRAIRTRREALGLSQEAAAHEAGISARYYADVERGTRSVSVEIACRIASALDTKLQSILDTADRGK